MIVMFIIITIISGPEVRQVEPDNAEVRRGSPPPDGLISLGFFLGGPYLGPPLVVRLCVII